MKEHQNRLSLPLIMPVILPSYGERASEVLIAQLTKNYKATVMLSDVSFRVVIKSRRITAVYLLYFSMNQLKNLLNHFLNLLN